METILTGLTLALIITIAVPLAILRAGIRHQDHATSLTSRPPGFSAALARRVLGLHASLPVTTPRPARPARGQTDQPPLHPARKGPESS
jgi:hypothetical protein